VQKNIKLCKPVGATRGRLQQRSIVTPIQDVLDAALILH